ncbi:tryptophan halogenase family protein [Catenovulum agarivorans]|uniref:tryptophan halogenase family protein n=1 Tax=Catenovulum agarivorans TaxID=1172192 RepID=UPI0002DED005|nr:tryptophan halogenase family protein [Catenovulum agarivorans]
MNRAIKRVIIAGGGTAGWMTAALLRKVLPASIGIRLVESEQIGIVGVGEATIPPIQTFNNSLGIDEKEFIRETQATIKLAIKFENWRTGNDSYYHTFAAPGTNLGFCSFQHYWLKAQASGMSQSLWDFDLNYLCCEQGKFNKINTSNPLYELQYAYHFDSALYGRFLRKHAQANGVKRDEGIIKSVQVNPQNGAVESLLMESGQRIAGDLFIDCTGTRALLLQQTLGVEYLDWSYWLPANSAITVPTQRHKYTLPYTRSIAHNAGWLWCIPLQHRNGNGLVYSDRFITDDEAQQLLLNNLDSPILGEPKLLKFKTGRVAKQWHKNVVAVGLASGFLEPLESTSIYLIQSAIVRLLKLFPTQGIHDSSVSLFNAECAEEYETIRDFIILHYYLNERNDSNFWLKMQQLELPQRMQQKIALFKDSAAIFNDKLDIFRDASWLQVMLGQGIHPQRWHPSADCIDKNELLKLMEKIRKEKFRPLEKMKTHDEFLNQYTSSRAV